MSDIGLQPYRDIIRDVENAPESVWHSISKDWYNSLLSEAEKLSIPKTCNTCKWWGDTTGFEAHGFSIDEEYYPGCKPCLKVEDGASITGSSMGCCPYILTDPSFGCIHHEPK